MDKISHIDQSKWTKLLICFCIFAFIFILNWMTPLIADDFVYLYSFYDGKRIQNIFQIFPSMWSHRISMNGRLVAHGLVQLMGIFPLWVFDVVNSLMFLLLLLLINRLGRGRHLHSNLMLTAVFFAVWLNTPAFGQLMLWQDGACNYLWSVVFALLFLTPITEDFFGIYQVNSLLGKIGFLLLSFYTGAYCETTSVGAIGIAVLLVIFMALFQKRKIRPLWIVSIIIACLGYLSIYTAPAQWGNKSAEFTASVLLYNMCFVAWRYGDLYYVLLAIFFMALIVNLFIKTDPNRMIAGGVFLAGSFAAHMIIMFAKYYTDRSTVGALGFLIAADCIMLYPLLDRKWSKRVLAAGLVVLAVVSVPALVSGTQDIANSYHCLRQNEQYILECKENGIMDVSVPLVYPSTKYSGAMWQKYLATEKANDWPNQGMCKYYGINSLIGYEP